MPYTYDQFFVADREIRGTSGSDTISSNTSVILSLGGDDSLSSTASSNYNFLFGGSGNDTYTVAPGSAATIFDTSGSDRIVAKGLGFYDPNTYVMTLDQQHVASFNTVTGDTLVVLNWLDQDNQIESLELSDATLYLGQLAPILSERPNFLGDYPITTNSIVRAIPAETTQSKITDYLAYIATLENPAMSQEILFSSNGHYYKAVPENVTWEVALANAEASSYRGLEGYLLTVTSAQENEFVWKQVVNPSDITGWGSFVGKQGYWLAASDRTSEGRWVWESGPEKGGLVATSNGPNNISSAIDGIDFWVPAVYNGSSQSSYDYAGISVPDPDKTLPPGYSADSVWDDLPTNISDSSYGVGNGYVIEYGGLPATYSIVASKNSVNEGDSIRFDVLTTNVEWGTSLNYSISGISAEDLSSGALNGSMVVQEGGDSGKASVTLSLSADQLTEGTEVLTLTVNAQSKSVTVNDTSIPIVTPIPPSEFEFIGTETLNFDFGTASNLVPGFQFSHGSTYSIWVYDNTARLEIDQLEEFDADVLAGLIFNDNAKTILEGEYVAFQSDLGEVSILKMDDPYRRLDGDSIDGVKYSAWSWLSDNLTPEPPADPPQTNVHQLDVIVDLLGQVLYLRDLTETVTTTSHTVEYAGITFNWSDVDSFVTTVVRDNEFTEEFAKEISDAFPSVAGISYQTALTIIGTTGIQEVLLMVAGADGNYVG